MAGPAPWNFAINHKHVHTYHSHHSCINMPLCDKQEKIPQVSFHQQFLFRSEHLWSLCCTWCPSWKDAPRPVSILSLRSASKLSKAKKGNWARSHKLTLDRAYSTTAAQRSLRPQSLPKSFWFFHREEWDFLKYTNTMKIANCSNQLEDIWLNWNHECTWCICRLWGPSIHFINCFPIFVKVRGFEGAPKLVAAAAHFLLQLQLAASHPPSPTPAHFQQLPILCLLFVHI